MVSFWQNITIDEQSLVPKYMQLVRFIVYAIESGMVQAGERLPSIHECCVTLDVSKNTVEKAYQYLMAAGLINGLQGKGYFIC